ncbi:unnamed protein product [Phaedon cochleariae]|uniref:Adenosine deaminase n=1 Tax=Phaedon cochleariae TaxID=80249 RepID=A0A9P0DIY1_PHACE|nr:unnamed protein product [Phaedon cochleariae]
MHSFHILSVASTFVMCCAVVESDLQLHSDDHYLNERNRILKLEKYLFAGGQFELTDKEKRVNEIILQKKKSELSRGYKNVSDFLPSQHFFQSRRRIDQSQVFAVIKNVPKGASLHTHLLAGVSPNYIIEDITYRDNIYGCYLNGTFKLRFLEDASQDTQCNWKKIKEYRKENPDFNSFLLEHLSLEVEHPSEAYPTPDVVWTRFKKIFTTEYDMVAYKPVFIDYIYRFLEELYMDNVFYTEIRGSIMPLYDLNGTVHDNEEFFKVFIDVVEKFKRDHPNFVGARYIHSIYRGVGTDDLRSGLKQLTELQRKFPDFIAGFDFVGFEEEGKRLVDFHEVLLEFSEDLKFFFHAGETNWFGHTDLNLVDAILLNSSRIGHGFGLDKHPVVTKMAKEKGIAIELSPISNQVLLLNNDPRNHPAVPLMAKGLPVVICNDDPSAWGATGLSYDWYIVFMAMTPENAGIEVLKQFAVDSIKHSAMSEPEKIEAMHKWTGEWEKFLDEMLYISCT